MSHYLVVVPHQLIYELFEIFCTLSFERKTLGEKQPLLAEFSNGSGTLNLKLGVQWC